ncbi:MAG: hypothetical protein DWQ05_08050 [Calditrichaeota bacterium]|nr:MAG: hypothetical protein DWQ05_08050 [Calditrichota bacterium]
MIEKLLLVFGATILGVLGLIHLLFTFFTNKFDAVDQSVSTAMKKTSPVLTKETTMWDAWIGFNASHSFGVLFFAGFYVPLAFNHIEIIQTNWWFSFLPMAFGFCYLVLAKKYWFRIPYIGILISTCCFAIAVILINT